MAETPNTYTLKGRLQIIVEGQDQPVELGNVEIPIRVDFRRPGPNLRGEVPVTVNVSAPDAPADVARAVSRSLAESFPGRRG